MRTCTICTHQQRIAIETAIASGTSYRHISSQFGVGYKSVERHATSHIQQAIKEVQEAKEAAGALNVVQQLKDINSITLDVLAEARKAQEHMTTLYAIDRVMKQLELQSKLLGDLDERNVINILQDPQWVNMRELIFRALQSYPEALRAVAEALWKEGQSGKRIAS